MTQETNTNTEEQVKMNPERETSEVEFDSALIDAYTTKSGGAEYTQDRMQCNLVLDLGASQTRSALLFNNKPISKKDMRVTESRYAIIDVDENLNMYKKTSEDVSENGQYIIKEEESEFINYSWFAEPKQILKGRLIDKLGKAPRSIDNQRDKSEDIGIFVNLLTSIADIGLAYGVTNLKVRLGFPIPPKERYSDEKRVNEIKKRVAGLYTIKMPRYDYTVNVVIDPNDVIIEAEGEAAFIYFTTRGKDARARYDEYQDKLVTIQDLGSSTFNIGLISDGSIQSGVSHTAKIGGENLVSKFYQILSRSRKEAISFEQARSAVENGYIRLGAEVIPVGEELTKAKKELTEMLVKEFITFLQVSGKPASAIYAHLFVGRGMLETGTHVDGEPTPDYSPSIAHLLSREYQQMSQTTESVILNNPGLANLLGIASLMKMSWKLN